MNPLTLRKSAPLLVALLLSGLCGAEQFSAPNPARALQRVVQTPGPLVRSMVAMGQGNPNSVVYTEDGSFRTGPTASTLSLTGCGGGGEGGSLTTQGASGTATSFSILLSIPGGQGGRAAGPNNSGGAGFNGGGQGGPCPSCVGLGGTSIGGGMPGTAAQANQAGRGGGLLTGGLGAVGQFSGGGGGGGDEFGGWQALFAGKTATAGDDNAFGGFMPSGQPGIGPCAGGAGVASGGGAGSGYKLNSITVNVLTNTVYAVTIGRGGRTPGGPAGRGADGYLIIEY